MTKFTKAYDSGFQSKTEEIKEMGFSAARDKFNTDCPVGVKWQGSKSGLEFVNGEMAALENAIAKGLDRI